MRPHPLPQRLNALAVAGALMSLSALGGAVGLIGGRLDLGHRLSSRLPFDSPVFGGVALAVVVAVPFAAAACRAWRGDRQAWGTALSAGLLLIGWIVVELAFIREFSFLQPMCVAIGAAFAVAGYRGGRASTPMVDRGAVDRFVAHHRVALVGASADPRRFGNTVFRALRDHGYEVVPVNPHAADIEGIPCVRSIAEVDSEVDAAMIMVTGVVAVAAVHACADRGIHHVWLFQGVGSPGAVSADSVAACRDRALDAVVGACPLMFLQPMGSLHKVHRAVRQLEGAVG
jgi:predicted CoA-binding protein